MKLSVSRDPYSAPYDLISPDGKIISLQKLGDEILEATVDISSIHPNFLGFSIDKSLIDFNLKSTIAQLGVNCKVVDIDLSATLLNARVVLHFYSIGPLGKKLLSKFSEGMFVGKLFAADDRRRVRFPAYIQRIFKRTDRKGRPLIDFGKEFTPDKLIFQEDSTRTIVRMPIKAGIYEYAPSAEGFIDTVALALKQPKAHVRFLLPLHQEHINAPHKIKDNHLLLVKTVPLYMRTLFARVINDQLPEGVRHTQASLLQPHQDAACEIYELFGKTNQEIYDIPLEFYTLESYREHVYFEDRDQLQDALENPEIIKEAFKHAPKDTKCATFIVKGEQLKQLTKDQWITSVDMPEDPITDPPFSNREIAIIDRFIERQPAFPILRGIHNDLITSEGVLFTRYFPSTFLKRLLINARIRECLKAIYFLQPSYKYGDFFSAEDRAMLRDFANASIEVYWSHPKLNLLLKYAHKKGRYHGMFVPIDKVKAFQNATIIGIYGSNLIGVKDEGELKEFLRGVLKLKEEINHPLLNPKKEMMILTGGGPGVMACGNRMAVELGILSGGNAVDFTNPPYSSDPIHSQVIHTEEMNPYIQALMTYRLEQIIYRQAEFHLDLPIILRGGTGTDFELALEHLRTQLGLREYIVPVLLFGEQTYWENKISSKFRQNLETGTVRDSEWTSNTFFLARNCNEALEIYSSFFRGTLPIGPQYQIFDRGFRLLGE